jgi:hypothetical protein
MENFIEKAVTRQSDYKLTYVWKNGIWEDGVWEDGVWFNGIWHNGTWEKGYWEKGDWYNGWIFDPEKKGKFKNNWEWKNSYVLSYISPKEYFKEG